MHVGGLTRWLRPKANVCLVIALWVVSNEKARRSMIFGEEKRNTNDES